MLEELREFTGYFTHTWAEVREVLLELNKLEESGSLSEEVNNQIDDIVHYSGLLVQYIDEEEVEDRRLSAEAMVSMLEISHARRLLKMDLNTGESKKLLQEIHGQVYLLAASFGLAIVYAYSPDEFTSVLGQEGKQYDIARVLYTCREDIKAVETEHYLDAIITFLSLGPVIDKKDMKWEDALLLSMFIQLTWVHFPYLNVDDRDVLLRNYFYRGLVAGAAVRFHIQYHMYQSREIYDYIFRHATIVDALENSKEEVLVDMRNNTYKALSELLSKFKTKEGEEATSGFGQQEYAKSLYQDIPGRDKYTSWLLEVYYIFFHVQTVTIIKEPIYEINESVQYNSDLVSLYTWFLVESRWNNIVDYFKSKNKIVKLPVFLHQSMNTFNIENQEIVEMFMKFNSFLQKGGILKEAEDIVEFHEEDGQFHWNKDLVS